MERSVHGGKDGYDESYDCGEDFSVISGYGVTR